MDRRTFDLPTEVVVELRFKGCTCDPLGVEVDHASGGTARFAVHADSCRLLWLRMARWN